MKQAIRNREQTFHLSIVKDIVLVYSSDRISRNEDKAKMRRNLQKRLGSLLLVYGMLVMTSCSKEKNVAFTQVKTTGVIKVISPQKITMVVEKDDSNFKKGEEVVVYFERIYEDDSQIKTDILKRTDELYTGDKVSVIYGENQRKGAELKVDDLVREK